MVRFSQTLGDRQSKSREKPYVQFEDNPYYQRQPQVAMPRDDRLYSQPVVCETSLPQDISATVATDITILNLFTFINVLFVYRSFLATTNIYKITYDALFIVKKTGSRLIYAFLSALSQTIWLSKSRERCPFLLFFY